MAGIWFRWPEFDFFTPSSIFQWPGVAFSYFTSGWTSLSFRSWFDFSVDNVFWTVVTVIETVALVTMLCCFFVFCGCTL